MSESERLVELAWQVDEGSYAELARIVEAQGGTFELKADGDGIAHTWDGRTVGFSQGDPVSSYVQVCFALFGVWWPFIDSANRGMKVLEEAEMTESENRRRQRYVESPQSYTRRSGNERVLFLAGGISHCPDWQQDMREMLIDADIVLLNPRRRMPMGDPSAARIQITWEFDHLRLADAILFWFPVESLNPIVLFELGYWSASDKLLFVGVHPGYRRRVDVEIQMSLIRPTLRIAYDLGDLARSVCRWCCQGAGRG